jgi:hypothetical protein
MSRTKGAHGKHKKRNQLKNRKRGDAKANNIKNKIKNK